MSRKSFDRNVPALKAQESKGDKRCPHCRYRFDRSPRRFIEWADCKANICPDCSRPLFYRRVGGKVVEVVPLEDKLLVDDILSIFNDHLTKISGEVFDFGEATSRERKLAYDMIGWANSFLNDAQVDLGMTTHEFLRGFLEFILADEWWGIHMTSLLMVSNSKQRLAWEYFEHEARQRGIETPYAARVAKKLKELVNSFSKGDSDDGYHRHRNGSRRESGALI